MEQIVKGEGISIRALQVLSAFGVAVILYNIILSVPLYVSYSFLIDLLLLVVVLILYCYFCKRLESALNDVMYRLVSEPMRIRKVLDLINSVLFGERSILDDLREYLLTEKDRFRGSKEFQIYLRISSYFVLPAISLFMLLVLVFIILNEVAPSKFLAVSPLAGFSLLVLAYIIMVVLKIKPISRTGYVGREIDFQQLATSITEKYTYENVVKVKSVSSFLISLLVLLLPLPKLDIRVPGFWFGLYMCNSKLLDAIKELRKNGRAEVEGDLNRFFSCGELGGTEKWVELQEISPEEMLEKVMGESDRPTQMLKVTIKDNGKNVAYIVIKAWKGCRLHRRLRRYREGYRLEIDRIERWKVLSVFMMGIREYVEALRMRIELATRKAITENILCEEEQKAQQ